MDLSRLREFHEWLSELVGGADVANAVEAAAALLILTPVVFWVRWRISPEARRQRAIRRRFRTLAAAHGLAKGDRQLLLTFASDLQDPSLIFVQRSHFEAAAAKLPAPPSRVNALRNRLYQE